MKPGSLYDRIFGFLGQLIALNLLWIVCSLPVITAGASTTALYYCTLKLHKDGDIRVFHDFFKSFKQNFKQSTLIWILMAAVAVFLYMEKESLVTMPGSMPQIFNYVILAVCIPLIAIALYIFPTVAAFENKTMTLITNAFYFAVTYRLCDSSGSDHDTANDHDTCRCKTFSGISADLADGGIFPDSLCRFLVYVETVQTVFQRGRRRTSLCRYRTGSVCFLTKKQQRNERYRVWNGLSIMRQKKYLT